MAKTFLVFRNWHKNRKKFGKDFLFFNFLLEIDRRMKQNFSKDLMFWQKKGLKFLKPTYLFLDRTAALFTSCHYFRNRKKITLPLKISILSFLHNDLKRKWPKNCSYFVKNKAILLTLRFAA